MSSKFLRRAAVAVALVAGSALAVTHAETKSDMPFPTGVSVITQPSATRHLQFMSAGVIRENMVKDGDHVKAGQMLLRQDTDLIRRKPPA